MEVDPISSTVGVSPVTAAAAYAHQAHLSPAQTHLAESHAKEGETPEQLAAAGDPLAIVHLEQAAAAITPVRSQGLEPAHHAAVPADHAPGAHEPGKGDLIDVYD
jgi:hypothetical protein